MTAEPQILATCDAARVLDSGGVLLLETDTLPGFHCRVDRPGGMARIVDLKGRTPEKPFLLLAGSLEQALGVCGPLAARQASYCRQCWPGPFSLILPAGEQLPPEAVSVTGGVAIRVPTGDRLSALLVAVGVPLVSTSANRAGDAPLGDLADAWSAFDDAVDGVWTSSPDTLRLDAESPGVVPAASGLVDLTTWPPQVLREGPRKAPDPAC